MNDDRHEVEGGVPEERRDAACRESESTDGMLSALRRLIGAGVEHRASERELASRLQHRVDAAKHELQDEIGLGRELRQRYREVRAGMTEEQRDAFFEGYLESLRRATMAKTTELKLGFIEDLVACRGAPPTGRTRSPSQQPEPLLSEGAGGHVPEDAGCRGAGDPDGR